MGELCIAVPKQGLVNNDQVGNADLEGGCDTRQLVMVIGSESSHLEDLVVLVEVYLRAQVQALGLVQ
jgi:hypothetical protein